MSLVILSLARGKALSKLSRSLSSIAANPIRSSLSAKRTSIDDPNGHTADHIGLFYTVPEPIVNQLFSQTGLPKPFKINCKTFNECSIMVRTPAVELIDRLKNTNWDKPVVRYVIYGRKGCGKSLTISHLLHYAFVNKFVIVHVPWAWNFYRNNLTEVVISPKDKKLFDVPVLSAQWLKHFQQQNGNLLDSLNTSKDYVWSQRESTPAGSPLSALVTHGINRVKYAAECILALFEELKSSSKLNKCKVFVSIDGFNAIVNDYATQLKTEDRVKVRTGMVSLTHAFRLITKQDWNNGVVVVTVDELAAPHETLTSHWPIYLLGRKGFEHLDPFIPINVTEYSDVELNNMLDYYESKMWLQRTEGRQELGFLSNNNPHTLMNLVSAM